MVFLSSVLDTLQELVLYELKTMLDEEQSFYLLGKMHGFISSFSFPQTTVM